jgi:serine kinase of HPr protein (carbohydrate metabolism regulator)
MDRTPFLIHATSVDLGGMGVLLRGPSGSGKSDLALRLIDGGAMLIADDQTELTTQNGQLIASPPASIQGMIEVRGLGLYHLAYAAAVPIGLVVDLVAEDHVERLPDPETETMQGVAVARLRLSAFNASTPAKLRLWASAQQGLTPARKIVL